MSQELLNLNLPAPPPPPVRAPRAAAPPPPPRPASLNFQPATHFRPDPLMADPALGPDVEVGTAIGSRLLGVGLRTLRRYCDEGVLREGAHWRRNTPRSPFLIRRRALIAKKLALL